MQQESTISANGVPGGHSLGTSFVSSGVSVARRGLDAGISYLNTRFHSFTISGGQVSTNGHHDFASVSLSRLIISSPRIAGMKVTLGLDAQNRPVQLNLQDRHVGNVLISGQKGAGKSSLLRTIAASAALEYRQSSIQIATVALTGSKAGRPLTEGSLDYIGELPHCIFPVIRTVPGGLDVVDFLVEELDYRRKKEISNPLLIVIIDGLEHLLASGERILYRKLGHLLNHGPDSGFRLFVSIEDALAKELRPLLRYDFPLRLVGGSADYDRAWAAAGIPDSGAESISRSGEFIAVRGENCHRFQSAFISDDEFLKYSRQLEIQKGRTIVVQPLSKDGAAASNGASSRSSKSIKTSSRAGYVQNGQDPASENESGSDDWLTADWIDRFWMDRN